MSDAAERASQALNRLCKWRTVFTGWQLGTRPKGDPECDAVRDATDARLVMRAEVSAFTQLLVDKGVCSVDELNGAVAREADILSLMLEAKFPGFKATDEGITVTKEAAETMKGWKP